MQQITQYSCFNNTCHGADLASFDQVFIVYVVGGLMVASSVILELFTCLGAMVKKKKKQNKKP